jgi:Leucine-rich repeat (LRR) protein
MNSDIIFCIFEYLDPPNLLKCSLVDKLFNSTSKSELLWKRLCDIDHFDMEINNDYRKNYKDYYKLNKFLRKYNKKVFHGLTMKSKKFEYWNNTCCHNFSIFPNEVCLLTNLQFLNLGLHSFKSLPSEISLLTNLTHFRLPNNDLREIPEEIGSLTNLKKLELMNNGIKLIPSTIGLLTNLTSISLFNNNLESLPDELTLLTNLRELILNDDALLGNMDLLTTCEHYDFQ